MVERRESQEFELLIQDFISAEWAGDKEFHSGIIVIMNWM
jgi:hypothetical protein